MATKANDAGAYVYVSYPRTADIRFDTEYYINKHCALVDKHWKAFGLKSCTVVQFAEDDPSGLHTQAILLWDSVEDFDKAIGANIPELMQDLPNYSNGRAYLLPRQGFEAGLMEREVKRSGARV